MSSKLTYILDDTKEEITKQQAEQENSGVYKVNIRVTKNQYHAIGVDLHVTEDTVRKLGINPETMKRFKDDNAVLYDAIITVLQELNVAFED